MTQEEILEKIKEAFQKATDFFNLKKYDVALIILHQILKINPDNLDAIRLAGLIYYQRQQYKQAINLYEEGIKYQPCVEFYNNTALAYSQLGQFHKAIEQLQQAIHLDPERDYLYGNIGLQFRFLYQYDLAIPYFQKSLDLEEKANTWCALGGCYGECHNLDEAERCFKKAIEKEPNSPNSHCCLATIYQLKKNWSKAWEEYEWRFDNHENIKEWVRIFDPNKLWKREPLENKRILLYGEQGIGDSIHFFRYVQLIKKMGAYVIVHCTPDLESLYRPHVDATCVVAPHLVKDVEMPHYDYFASLMSLPYLLNNPAIPETPYLFTDKKFNLDQYKGFKIGIAWAGNPQHPNDCFRSCRLENFREIQKLPGVQLFSLQKDTRLRQYRFQEKPIDLTENCNDFNLINMNGHMNTFEDTASILKALDLTISVDTSLVHLAGALNVPIWTLLPYNVDWRWGLTGETTEWYSSMKLFRQPNLGNWKPVFDEILSLVRQKN